MNQQFHKRRAGMIGMICLLVVSLSSCLKDHNDDYIQQPVALVSAINASPDATSVDFYLDQNRGNFNVINSGESMDYIRAYVGKRTISFNQSGSQQKIKSDTATFKKDKLYSVFLANKAATPDFLLITDSIAQPAANMATVRFVNLSPNTASAELAITGGAVVATGKAYRTYSAFVPVQGNASYSFEVRTTGTNNVLATVTNAQLRAGSVYTVWLQGFAGATDQTKLSAHIQNNVYFY